MFLLVEDWDGLLRTLIFYPCKSKSISAIKHASNMQQSYSTRGHDTTENFVGSYDKVVLWHFTL